MKKWKFHSGKIKFEPRDIWVGVSWDVEEARFQYDYQVRPKNLLLVICLIPTLPLLLYFEERD
jgi:hypothetical protein